MYCVFYRVYCLSSEHPIQNPYAKSFDSMETAKVWVVSDRKKALKDSEKRGLTVEYEDGDIGGTSETAFATLVVSVGTEGTPDYKQYIIRWDILPLD